ncbi:MAG: sulfur transferase, selenocysteine-containing [uncultured bacterium]|nr:MAG: sulfur transferase, selenocysteine-containing [uncultured bacterium]
MKKTFLKLGLGALLTATALMQNEAAIPFAGVALAADAATATTPAESKTIQGKIANISQKAKTIALSTKEGEFFLMKFTDATVLKGAGSADEFKEDEAIIALYTTSGGENIATSLEKDVVKLPEGIQEIKTEELAGLMSAEKNLVIIDSRPAVKYDEGHIPGAVSIPFAKLVTMGDEGAQLLARYQDRQLVFYCGGTT